MEANELNGKNLMVGDWVVYEGDTNYDNPIRIEGMDIATKSLITSDREDVGFDGIEPIPLTAEILEKNRWKIISNTPNKLEYLWSTGATEEYADVRVLVGKDRNNVLRWNFPALNIHLYRGDIGLTKFKYVHELQHALRLCGIDKEIVL